MPGVFSPSEISPSKQTPGSLGIKEVLSLRSRRKDEEQKGIKCLAESLLGDKLNQSCSKLSAQCHCHRLLCHCLLQLKPGSGPGPSHLSQLFTLFQDSVSLPWDSIPACPHGLAACGAHARLSKGIYFRFLSSVLQLEMRRSRS